LVFHSSTVTMMHGPINIRNISTYSTFFKMDLLFNLLQKSDSQFELMLGAFRRTQISLIESRNYFNFHSWKCDPFSLKSATDFFRIDIQSNWRVPLRRMVFNFLFCNVRQRNFLYFWTPHL